MVIRLILIFVNYLIIDMCGREFWAVGAIFMLSTMRLAMDLGFKIAGNKEFTRIKIFVRWLFLDLIFSSLKLFITSWSKIQPKRTAKKRKTSQGKITKAAQVLLKEIQEQIKDLQNRLPRL